MATIDSSAKFQKSEVSRLTFYARWHVASIGSEIADEESCNPAVRSPLASYSSFRLP
jgi:hypothetical protein